jgi:hypothetical protein
MFRGDGDQALRPVTGHVATDRHAVIQASN